MPQDLDIRRLRYFVAVAERLHFTRAAEHLHVAQQAVSREVRKLEDDLGAPLFDRSTRKVRLTPAGTALLERAQELLALHDAVVDEVRGVRAPLVVDAIAENLTPHLIIRVARDRDQDVEIVTRTSGGLAAALPQLMSGSIDVAFGHIDPARLAATVRSRMVRNEPLGLLVPVGHPFAVEGSVPTSRLRGTTIDTSAGNPDAAEWTELAAAYLADWGARPSAPHHHVVGPEETARHLVAEGNPILSHTTTAAVPGAVVVPLTDPIPTYLWRMLWRRSPRHPVLGVLHDAVDRARAVYGWDPPAAGPTPVG
jgi:DNA-binding transcriptional LysR family regulator